MKFRVEDGVYPVREQTDSSNELTWREDQRDDEKHVIAETDDGKVVARFDSTEDVDNAERTDVEAYREQNDQGE